MIPFSHLNLRQIIEVYVVYAFIFTMFLYLAYKILKHRKTKLLVFLSGFYITVAVGLGLNFIYVNLTDPATIRFLNFLTNFFIVFGIGFLTIFCMTLLKGEDVITPMKQAIYLIVYGTLLFLMIFIPRGIEISPETNWNPHWSIFTFLYVIIIMTIMTTIPIYYCSIKLYYRFKNTELRKKWKLFIIGTIMLYIVVYGTFLSHVIFNPMFYQIFSPIKFVLAVFGAIFMYYGVTKQF